MFGLDVTDEFQYYHQMLSLTNTGYLFSNDLYIQQIIYIIFYPLFKIWTSIFGDNAFIIFCRSILALCLIILYFASYKIFQKFLENKLVSLNLALCLSFSITQGIFVLNYNVIAQIGWISFLLIIIGAKRFQTFSLAVTIVLTGLAAPTAGVIMAMSYAGIGLYQKKWKPVLKTAITSLGISFLGILLLLYFTDIPKLFESLLFSSGYSVGTLFSSQKQIIGLFLTTFMILLATFAPVYRILANWVIILLVLSLCYFFYDIVFDEISGQLTDLRTHRFTSSQIAYGLTTICTIAIYAARCFSYVSYRFDDKFKLIVIIPLIQGVTAACVSSVGYRHLSMGLLVLLPIMVAMLASNVKVDGRKLRLATALPCILVTILFLGMWKLIPYRDDIKIYPSSSFAKFAIAKGIIVSDRITFNQQEIFRKFSELTSNKSGMIFSSKPAVYSYLSVNPVTCMIYTHSTGNKLSEEILRNCLLTKSPEFILIFHDNDKGSEYEKIIGLAFENVSRLKLNCQHGLLSQKNHISVKEIKSVKYHLCI